MEQIIKYGTLRSEAHLKAVISHLLILDFTPHKYILHEEHDGFEQRVEPKFA